MALCCFSRLTAQLAARLANQIPFVQHAFWLLSSSNARNNHIKSMCSTDSCSLKESPVFFRSKSFRFSWTNNQHIAIIMLHIMEIAFQIWFLKRISFESHSNPVFESCPNLCRKSLKLKIRTHDDECSASRKKRTIEMINKFAQSAVIVFADVVGYRIVPGIFMS